MKNRLRDYLTLHYALHRFRKGGGMGNATIEANLAQQLVGISHEPLFQVFIDMRKA